MGVQPPPPKQSAISSAHPASNALVTSTLDFLTSKRVPWLHVTPVTFCHFLRLFPSRVRHSLGTDILAFTLLKLSSPILTPLPCFPFFLTSLASRLTAICSLGQLLCEQRLSCDIKLNFVKK